MRRIATLLLLALQLIPLSAQTDSAFIGRLQNAELQVFIDINTRDHNVVVPGQEIFGEVDGYIASHQCSSVWLITSADSIAPDRRLLSIINNDGSEDLRATLILNDDGTYTLRQDEGSTIKFPINRKWVKIPKLLRLRMFVQKH